MLHQSFGNTHGAMVERWSSLLRLFARRFPVILGVAQHGPAEEDEVAVARERTLVGFHPDAQALAGSSRALWEYLGLRDYRQRGWAVK